MARIPYTNYGFKPPTEPLSDEQFEALRHLSDADFKKQLRLVKKTAGHEGNKQFRDSWKFCLIVLVVCCGLGEISDRLSKVWKVWGVFEAIASLCGALIAVALFGTLYSSLLSLSSSSRFVAEVAKFLKKQRSVALKVTSYQEFLSSFPEDKNRRGHS